MLQTTYQKTVLGSEGLNGDRNEALNLKRTTIWDKVF